MAVAENMEPAPAAAGTPDAPVRSKDRLVYLDTLRGLAVMAIFIVNVKAMAMPFSYYTNPVIWGNETDTIIAHIQHFLVDNKWRTIFTALFGAGLVLLGEKAAFSGGSGSRRLTLRLFWLMLFGLCHLLFIWSGDILFAYALAGFGAMWFRNLSLRTLTIVGICCLAIALVWTGGFGVMPAYIPELEKELAAEFWGTDPALTRQYIDIALGPVAGQLEGRLYDAPMYIGMYMLMGGHLFLTFSIMLMGMALFKAGFLRGEWSMRSYAAITLLFGVATGALEMTRLTHITQADFTYAAEAQMTPVTMLAGLTGAMTWASLVGLIMQLGLRLPPVAAAGRMAFTNYIASSLIGTTFFYGHGFGLFGSVSLQFLTLFAAGLFVAMLVWSWLWLKVFRFGPLEWLWRSLTYMKLQPMLK